MKILVTLFMLPLGLVLVLLALTVWLAVRQVYGHGTRHTGWLVALPLTALVLLYIAATPLCGRALGLVLVDHIHAQQLADPSQADAIVVLTGGMENAGPVGWLPRPESIHRMAVAYELQRLVNIRMPVIVSGGHTAGVTNPSEASVAANFFAHQRTELTPTELEETSLDTYESAMQLAPALARREAKTVYLVTGDLHMLRALATFRARGIDPVPFPALDLPEFTGVHEFMPTVQGLTLTTAAVYEMYGIAEYLLTGKISWRDISYAKV